MDCPVCKVELVMSERSGIEIDYCPKCRGVWLDRGELDKIIERAGAAFSEPRHEPRPDSRPEYRPEHREPRREEYRDERREEYREEYRGKEPYGYTGHGHHPKHKKHGVKNFLEELFD